MKQAMILLGMGGVIHAALLALLVYLLVLAIRTLRKE
jgi:hypothetical protein